MSSDSVGVLSRGASSAGSEGLRSWGGPAMGSLGIWKDVRLNGTWEGDWRTLQDCVMSCE
jgi:hypothetical protein